MRNLIPTQNTSVNSFDLMVFDSSGLLTYDGYTPLDVATATIKNNRELVLALEEFHLERVVQLLVATTMSVRNISSADSDYDGGLQFQFKRPPITTTLTQTSFSSMEWSPNGGGKCLEFLQSAVWVEGKFPFHLISFFTPIPQKYEFYSHTASIP